MKWSSFLSIQRKFYKGKLDSVKETNAVYLGEIEILHKFFRHMKNCY